MKLTRDEILLLDPDALNRAIWEAQGWVKLPPPAMPTWQRCTATGTQGWYMSYTPDYSKSIVQAWELVAGWNHIGSKWLMNLSYLGEAKQLQYQCIVRQPGRGKYFVADADTAPLAISRAWLIWKMEAEDVTT